MRTTLGTWLGMAALILAAGWALAISQGDIVLTSPASGTWTNLTNYSTGFVFQWNYADDGIKSANCTLYLGTDSSTARLINNASWQQWNAMVSNNTATTVYQSALLPQNNTVTYWTVRCFNATSTTPNGWAPTANLLYQDNVAPASYYINSVGFTNNTWVNTTSVRFEIKAVDGGFNTSATPITYTIENTSSAAKATGSIANNTLTNVTFALSTQGTHDLRLKVCDQGGNCLTNSTYYRVKVDSIFPTASYQGITPATGSVNTTGNVTVNVSVTEQNLDTVILNFDGTSYTSNNSGQNCTGTAPTYECTFKISGITAKRNKAFNLTINDSAGNSLVTPTRTFSVDTGGVVHNRVSNISYAASVGTFQINVTDTTPTNCSVRVYNSSGIIQSTITGSWDTTYLQNCTGTLTASNIVTEGAFTTEYYTTDQPTNSNYTNKTGIYSKLYVGWNQVIWGDVQANLSVICGTVKNCTQVSWFNNSAGTFTTYQTATPTVNAGTNIAAGDPILIYTNLNTSLLVNDYTPAAGTAGENVTTNSSRWNALGLLYNANMTSVLNAKTTTGLQNVTWASYYDPTAGKYYSCSKTASLCAGTSAAATTISLKKGWSVFILTNSDGVVLNRTSVQ